MESTELAARRAGGRPFQRLLPAAEKRGHQRGIGIEYKVQRSVAYFCSVFGSGIEPSVNCLIYAPLGDVPPGCIPPRNLTKQ